MPPSRTATVIDVAVFERRVSALESDSVAQSKTLTEYAQHFITIDRDNAVRAERDRNLAERLERIETNIANIYNVGKWFLFTFGAILVALISNFLFKGGFVIH